MPTTQTLLELVQALHGKFDAFREEYLREHAIVLSETRRAHERIDRLEKDLAKMIERQLEFEKFLPWMRAMAYLISALAVPIILAAGAFIWQIITHKVLFP